MRIIFSRKGFDSSAGGGPSPIVDGRPISLPIPAGVASRTSYNDLGLGRLAKAASRGKLTGKALCHHDPMFLEGGRAVLGQCSGAQTHLARHGVGTGDLFLFFGLFREQGQKPHHRIFGYLLVEEVVHLADGVPPDLLALDFPHALALHASNGNDAVYRGKGVLAQRASEPLRLTVPEGPPSLWHVPSWLRETGLSYHDRKSRWLPEGRLQSVARGQEFVADIGERADAMEWVDAIVAEIEHEPHNRSS